jgi:hypothetical protein
MKNKINKSIFVCMLVCATTLMIATTSIAKTITPQPTSPEIEWLHTFDSIINDRAYYVDQTTDGGYIFTGSTIVTPPGYTELLLVKTDGNGEESWRHNFPLYMTNLYGTVVHQTSDGGYIIVGSVGGSWLWDVQVTKTNANGDLVWQKSFGKSDGPDHGSDILQTSDGGYIVLGDTSSYGQGSADLWLIKLTADGTEQWNKTIGGAGFDEPKNFVKAIDGGYIIVGQTDSVDSMGDVWVVKTNEACDVSWQKTFGETTLGEYGVCVKTESNGYIILGIQNDLNWTETLWLLHLDAQGTLTSDQHIYGNGTLHGTCMTKTTDGGYFITGTISDPISYISDVYLLKLDYQGATQWVKTLDISNGFSDEANWGLQARDGGYIAVGSTGDLNNFTSDTFILKIKGEKGVVLDSVTARFGVQAHVKNLGSTDATGVNVSITITGGIFHHINVSHMETISIPAGEDTIVSCKAFLGLGPIRITVSVNGLSSDYEGRQFIILTQLES